VAPPPDREEWLDLIRRGERYALSLTHDEETARAAAHDAFIRLAERGGPWEVGYWLRTVRNIIFDAGRAAARRGERSSRGSQDALEARPAPGLSPADAVAQAMDNSATIEQLLAILEPEERELLYLADVEEMPAREIATLTGRSRAAILAQLQRIRERVRSRVPNPYASSSDSAHDLPKPTPTLAAKGGSRNDDE